MTSKNNQGDSEKLRLQREADAHQFGEAPIICGADGNGPRGGPDGQVDFGVGIQSDRNSVVLNFGTPIRALVLSRSKAKELRDALDEAIRALKASGTKPDRR